MKIQISTKIDESLFRSLKAHCALSGKKINQVLEEIITKYMQEKQSQDTL